MRRTHSIEKLRMNRSLFSFVLLAATPFAASAQDALSYDYVEAGYVRTDIGGDADGYGVAGSVSLDERFHVFGSYADSNANEIEGLDVTQWSLGAGFRHRMSDRMDLVTRFAWSSFDTKYSTDSNGITAEVGVRSALSKHLEGWALAGYGDLGHGDGEAYARVGAHAMFGDHWGVAGDVKFVSGDTQWFVGPRLRW